LYFAWLRERIGTDVEQLSPPGHVTTLGQLRAWLATRSDAHAAALGDPALIRAAVNQDYARDDHPVGPQDEVAFFPMVSGGCAR
jgi:molybdopterin synthase sulfur carrier subunit